MPQVVGVGSELSQGVEGLTEALNEEIARLRYSGELAKILEAHGIDGKAAEVGES